ncbi:MAG: phage integrase Arm DNA-binding domain-containing protein [Sedimenticola sp.]
MRPRNRNNRNLPPNLYISKKGKNYYYRYRNPVTGREHGMGSNRNEAIKAAIQLNNKLAFRESESLVEKVLEKKSTMTAYLDKYWSQVEERNLSTNTLYSRKHYVKIIREHFEKRPVAEITTREVAEFIEGIKAAGHARKAQATRSALIDIFNSAIADGWAESNPASPTRSPRVTIQRERLTLPEFQKILEIAEAEYLPYVANAMLLAMVTGQRVGDIANMRFRDISDGWLHVRQEKTGMMIRIPVALRLDAIGLSLEEVISRCRDRVISRYLIHHVNNRSNAPAGSPVHRDNISGWFRKARNKSGFKWAEKPPTFHEIRSLSGRLYKDQGIDEQRLLGHKDARTTSVYNDARGAEWAEVKA